jgi:DNA-directed RNA polymerase subunit D
MDITSFQKKDNQATFNVKGLDIGVLNAFRRTIIANIPVMAIEKVRFFKNNSILNDEILAHRLGLVPLKTELKTYNKIEECKCNGEGCGRCTAVLTLDVQGPKTVYSSELKSTDPEIKPVYDTIPLIKLADRQEIKLEAEAILGFGRKHMKWQAGLASYEIKKDHVEFLIESFGQYSIEELIKIALNEFQEKIKEVEGKLKKK